MEWKLGTKGTSGSSITALAYHPLRRDIITGHEDGTLTCWELDGGSQVATFTPPHKGWVTDLHYWAEGRVLFSSSVDGTVVQWSSTGVAYSTIELESPVYTLLWSPRKQQLVVGRKGAIIVYSNSGKYASNGLPLLNRKGYTISGHDDIVKCLACTANKVFTAGYDKKLFIYEVTSMPGAMDPPLKCIYVNHASHDAGITCLMVAKDTDSSTWIMTGSFDKKVKIWTADGKLIHSIQCSDTVTGVCYIPQTRVMWICAGTSHPSFYEPKSGENISDYVPVLGRSSHTDRHRVLHHLRYFPEIHEVVVQCSADGSLDVATTSRKEVLSWRYNPSCCVCIQAAPTRGHIETICYTSKVPILIFSGSYDGHMAKWERLQLNPFMYSQDPFGYSEQLSVHLDSEEGEKNLLEVVTGRKIGDGEKIAEEVREKAKLTLRKPEYRGFLKSLFVESLDFLIASALDGKIFVWGYDMKTVKVLNQMQRLATTDNGSVPSETEFGEAGNPQQMHGQQEESSIISRVAGFTCLHILNGHSSSVTGLAAVERVDETTGDKSVFLVSAGWDLTVCLWDLKTGSLVTQLKECLQSLKLDPDSEWNGDTIITDLDYSKEMEMFAYSASNNKVYLRRFAEKSTQMELVGILRGHTGEVTQVRWSKFTGKWITGSEDGTIRIWAADGSTCDQVVTVGDPVSIICVDKTYGYIIVAVQSIMKVYDCNLELLQVSRGHTDSIRTVNHIPELNQYISTGWDHTLRVWNAYHPKARGTNS